MPVPFHITCPTCHGKEYIYTSSAGYGNTDKTHGLPCPTCNCKGYLQKGGRVRTDKFHKLHLRVPEPKMKCPDCTDGKNKHNRKKRCKTCQGTQLKNEYVILHFVDLVISLEDYFKNK